MNSPLLGCDCLSVMSLAGISHLYVQKHKMSSLLSMHRVNRPLTFHHSWAYRPVAEYMGGGVGNDMCYRTKYFFTSFIVISYQMAASRGGVEVGYLSLHLLITNLEGDGIPSLKLDARSYVTITTLNACLCVCMS